MSNAEHHRTNSYYGAITFAIIVLTCFSSYLPQQSYYRSEWMVVVSFALGAIYTVLSLFGGRFINDKGPRYCFFYYTVQCALVTALVFLSPSRGYFGIIVLPLVAQAVFDLRPARSAVVSAYLFAINILLWAIPYGWSGAYQACVNYSAGFAFTIFFAVITRQALHARKREEKLRQEVEAANRQLRDYAEKVDDLATTRERNRLAREIHDGVGHYLTVVKTQLDAAATLLPTQPERARESVLKASHLAGEALDDVRRSVGTLRTDTSRPPLPEALRELAAHGAPIPTFSIEGAPRPLASAVEHALFRAAQEGLTNIRKHARATSALLVLDFRAPQRIRLELSDNGIGSSEKNSSPGFGLVGLRERIELLGGQIETANRLDGGFALTVEVPA